MSITKYFKGYFLRGLAILLPSILTIWVFVWGYGFIQNNISVHINEGLVRLTMAAKGLDYENEVIRADWNAFWIDGWGSVAGFAIAVIGVCAVGAMLANVVGKTLWRMVEKFIMNTPFLKQVYPHVKQITDFLFTQKEKEKMFSRVVAVEYPRKGLWSMGMVTGTGLKKVVDNIKKDFVTILIPTSPTPFTGFVVMAPKEDTIDLDMTIEEALRFAVSGGVITPESIKAAEAALSEGKSKSGK